ncbi:MAG: hypothetical protein JXQ99_18500 [Hyphomicrobiaceae bacterium]
MQSNACARQRTQIASVRGAPDLGLIGATCLLALVGLSSADAAGATSVDATPILERHTGLKRDLVSGQPRREDDQVVVDGWPMYRTERGQQAFNQAMATLKATDSTSPSAELFRGCERLRCNVTLPQLTRGGWIPAGRLWVSPNEYVLIVHSPRRSKTDPGRRRARRAMRYFVFHEFHNSTGNTDVFDTISAHRRSVFVPFYLGKPGRDAKGHNYVIAVQTAPHDIVSRHARVFGSAGPGIEVAKNRRDHLHRLQAEAGILVATIVKRAVPHLRMVRHRGTEGRPMLRSYQRQVAAWKRARGRPRLRLPFVAANDHAVASSKGRLAELIVHAGPVRSMPSALGHPTTLLAGIPQLVSAPRLVRIMRQPIMTMDKLVQRVLRPPVPPKPQPACRNAPGFICR